MKKIEAKNQVRLGPGRALQLAVSGMIYRFFRSGVTATILCLAVAFLVYTLISGFITQSTKYSAYQELSQQREVGEMINRLQRPDTTSDIISSLAQNNKNRLQEYKKWGSLSEKKLENAVATARKVLNIESHFKDISPENKAILGADTDVVQMLQILTKPAQFELFIDRMKQVSVSSPMGGTEEFQRFLKKQWTSLLKTIEKIREGHAEAISKIQADYPDRETATLLVSQPEGFIENLKELGFEVEQLDLSAMKKFAARIQHRQKVDSFFTDSQIKSTLSERMGIQQYNITSNTVFKWLRGQESEAEWLSELLADDDIKISSDKLLGLADYFVRTNQLQEIVGQTPPESEPGIFKMKGHLPWLILLAFIVCMVGVANAMLMSVTERFTEIATMKCLGALDGLVMMMFVFEAAIQGLAGGIIGIILGTLIALTQGFIEFGPLMAFTSEMAGDILIAGLASIGLGIGLASFAAIGPSLIAARLAPMEAMRVE